nr:prolyl oligopeptidase family serine peptidase [uncultured Undibacterium sp.]
MLRQTLLSLGLLLGQAEVSLAADKLIPIEHFVREDEYAQPRLSPDGKYLALTVRVPQNDRFVPMIVVYSLPDMKEKGAVRMPVYEVPDKYYWVSNTRLLVTKAKEVGSKEQPQLTGEILAMDYNGENQEYVYGYNERLKRNSSRFADSRGSGTVTAIPKARNGRFYMTTSLWEGERTMMYDVDSKNANRKLIASVPISNAKFILQNDGKPRFATGSDKDGLYSLYRFDDTKDDWVMLSQKEFDGHIVPIGFNADDTEFYGYYSKRGEPTSLVRVNAQTGALTVIAENKIANLDITQTSINSEMPFAVASNLGIPTMKYLDAERPETKLHQMLSAKFPGNLVNFINYTDDGNTLLFSVASDREPGAYFIFDKSRNRAYPLFASRQLIDPEQMSERRPIQFASRDGIRLDGYLTVPKTQNIAKKMPMIVLPHGGPHGPYDKWFYDNDAQFLASRGYSVLQVNFRGSGGKGNTYQVSGWRKWGAEIQNDLIDGVQWAIKEANVDAKRICTYGASFGGYSALMLAAREPDMFQCAIGYVGVYDLNLMFTSEEAKSPKFKAVMTRYLGTDKAELDRFSPAKQAERIKIPVMLAHGMDDKRATFNHAEAMREALIKQGRPPEWMAVPDEGHGFYNTKNVQEFYTRMEQFLAKHLGQ